MKPWTPRNGTAFVPLTIAGNGEIRKESPDFFSVSRFHGPVNQNAVWPLRNRSCEIDESTLERIRPSLFHWSISAAFFRNFGFARPMFDGSRLPAEFLPKM